MKEYRDEERRVTVFRALRTFAVEVIVPDEDLEGDDAARQMLTLARAREQAYDRLAVALPRFEIHLGQQIERYRVDDKS